MSNEFKAWLAAQKDCTPEAVYAACPRGDWLAFWHLEAGTNPADLTEIAIGAIDRARERCSEDIEAAGGSFDEDFEEGFELFDDWVAIADNEPVAAIEWAAKTFSENDIEEFGVALLETTEEAIIADEIRSAWPTAPAQIW